MPITTPQAAALAAALRAGRRHTDPEVISVTRVREIHDSSVKLSRAFAKLRGEQPVDTPTWDEQAEIDRITTELAGQHGLPAVDDEHSR